MKMQKSIRLGVVSVLAASLITLSGGVAVQKANAATVSNNHITYKTSVNDTITKIAEKYGISLTSLLGSNPTLSNGNWTWQGQTIQIPVKSGNGSNGTGSGSNGTGSGSNGNGSNGAGNGSNGSGSNGNGSSGAVAQDQFAAEVVTLVNKERAKASLSALKSDSLLTKVAVDKAKDMYTNNYFDHNSPTYGSPFDMMKSYGVTYSYAGENIAKGQPTPQDVMTAWMNSPGHKANILGANYNKIGVAYYKGEWVQEFTS